MNLRQIQDIAGHRDVPPWVIKLVQDCIEHDRMYEQEPQRKMPTQGGQKSRFNELELRNHTMNDQQRAAIQDAIDCCEDNAPYEAARILREALAQPQCNQHPDAPHGFDRNASHSADRYVCECESWAQPQGEWVDLTDGDLVRLWESGDLAISFREHEETSNKAIAKFKEVNNV